MEKIAILLPTRNRPQLLKRFWESIVDTSDDLNNISLYLYIDEDDSLTPPVAAELIEKYNNIFVFVGPRILHSKMPNVLFSKTNEDIMFLGGDDLIMRTPGWDTRVREAFDKVDDRIALVYGRDGGEALAHPEKFATHPILHRRWAEVLGYINPPYFSCDYADTWSNDLADAIGRKFLLPIFHEHMHFTFRKSEFDSTYREARDRFSADNIPLLYHNLSEQREKDVEKLKNYIESGSKSCTGA
jgi:glycosyltransferase involved in cell wall biosynthesis